MRHACHRSVSASIEFAVTVRTGVELAHNSFFHGKRIVADNKVGSSAIARPLPRRRATAASLGSALTTCPFVM